MSMSSHRVSKTFSKSSRPRKPDKRKRVPPVSIRLSDEERALLAPHAGKKPLSTYVREHVVRAHQGKRKSPAKSITDPVLAAKLLSALGRSEIPALLRQTLDEVDSGHLSVSRKTEERLRRAQEDIDLMRLLLVQSLGLRQEKPS